MEAESHIWKSHTCASNGFRDRPGSSFRLQSRGRSTSA
jgi:hypothetical protein